MSDLILVTTDDCRFCDRAHTLLGSLGVGFRELSVASPEARSLAERGIPLAFLPVLIDGQRVLAYGRFSERRLLREIDRDRMA